MERELREGGGGHTPGARGVAAPISSESRALDTQPTVDSRWWDRDFQVVKEEHSRSTMRFLGTHLDPQNLVHHHIIGRYYRHMAVRCYGACESRHRGHNSEGQRRIFRESEVIGFFRCRESGSMTLHKHREGRPGTIPTSAALRTRPVPTSFPQNKRAV